MVAAFTELFDERRSLVEASSVRRRPLGAVGLGLVALLVVLQVAVGSSGGSTALGAMFALLFMVGTVLARSLGRRVDARWLAAMGTLHVAGVVLATL